MTGYRGRAELALVLIILLILGTIVFIYYNQDWFVSVWNIISDLCENILYFLGIISDWNQEIIANDGAFIGYSIMIILIMMFLALVIGFIGIVLKGIVETHKYIGYIEVYYSIIFGSVMLISTEMTLQFSMSLIVLLVSCQLMSIINKAEEKYNDIEKSYFIISHGVVILFIILLTNYVDWHIIAVGELYIILLALIMQLFHGKDFIIESNIVMNQVSINLLYQQIQYSNNSIQNNNLPIMNPREDPIVAVANSATQENHHIIDIPDKFDPLNHQEQVRPTEKKDQSKEVDQCIELDKSDLLQTVQLDPVLCQNQPIIMTCLASKSQPKRRSSGRKESRNEQEPSGSLKRAHSNETNEADWMTLFCTWILEEEGDDKNRILESALDLLQQQNESFCFCGDSLTAVGTYIGASNVAFTVGVITYNIIAIIFFQP